MLQYIEGFCVCTKQLNVLIYAAIIEFILEAFLPSVAASQFTSRYLDPLLNIPGTDCSHKIGGLLLQESLMI